MGERLVSTYSLLAVSFLIASSCVRSTDPVPPLGEGAFVTGTVVERDLVSGDFVGAERVVVRALGTSISATTDERGFFQLDRLPVGRISIMAERKARGNDHAAAIVLEPINALVEGQSIDLGELRLFGTGSVQGSVLVRPSDNEQPRGMGGSLVSVVQTSFKAVTNDDGVYVVSGVPEGTFALAAFRPGYDAARIPGMRISAFDRLFAPDRVLDRSEQVVQVDVKGHATLQDQDDSSGISVELIDETCPERVLGPVQTVADGTFTVTASAGIYRARFAREGYMSVEIAGLAVLPEGVLGLLPIVLYPLQPNDLDGDGILDSEDPDQDNDGCLNEEDAFPRDPFSCTDTDGDGIPDELDPDDDDDFLSDAEELSPGRDGWITDPLRRDTDLDGHDDNDDVCPEVSDPEQIDTNNDGVGDVCSPTEEILDLQPVITDIQPRQGVPGTRVDIAGLNFFPDVTANFVRFGLGSRGLAVPTSVAPLSMVVMVPELAETGTVTIYSGGRVAHFPADDPNEKAFCVLSPPEIIDFFPKSVRRNGYVQFIGRRLVEDACRVPAGSGVRAQFPGPGGTIITVEPTQDGIRPIVYGGASVQQVTFRVPEQAVAGLVLVAHDDGSDQTSALLNIESGPSIGDIQPRRIPVGASVFIQGNGFLTDDVGGGDVLVQFSGNPAPPPQTPISRTNNVIEVLVPVGTETGPVAVLHPAGDVQTSYDLRIDNQLPHISAIVPYLALADGTQTISLRGNNLGSAVSVLFGGGVSTTTFTVTPGVLEVVVPVGAQPDVVYVDCGTRTATSADRLHILEIGANEPSVTTVGLGYSGNGAAFYNVTQQEKAEVRDSQTLQLVGSAIELHNTFLPAQSQVNGFQVAPDRATGVITASNPDQTYVVDLPSFTLRGVCSPADTQSPNPSSQNRLVFDMFDNAYAVDLQSASDSIFRIKLTAPVECEHIALPAISAGLGLSGILPSTQGPLFVSHDPAGIGYLDISGGVANYITEPTGTSLGNRDNLFFSANQQYIWGSSFVGSVALARVRPFTNDPIDQTSAATGYAIQSFDRRWVTRRYDIIDLERREVFSNYVDRASGLAFHPRDVEFMTIASGTTGFRWYKIHE